MNCLLKQPRDKGLHLTEVHTETGQDHTSSLFLVNIVLSGISRWVNTIEASLIAQIDSLKAQGGSCCEVSVNPQQLTEAFIK